jgi:hypothetical protein
MVSFAIALSDSLQPFALLQNETHISKHNTLCDSCKGTSCQNLWREFAHANTLHKVFPLFIMHSPDST